MNDVLIWILILMILLHGRVWSLRSYLVQSSPRRQQLSSSSSCPSPGKQQPYSPVRSKNVEDDHELNLGLGQEKVLYVDDDVIVVDKPSRAQSAPGFLCQDSLATRLASTFRINRVDKMIVHRLDYATSGVIVYARNEWSLSHLHAQFRATGKVKKSYLAIVDGNIPNDEGEVDLPLGKDSQRGSPFCCVDLVDGKRSKTFWQVKQRSATATLVQLFPLTGR